MNKQQARRIRKAESLIQAAIAEIKAVTEALPSDGPKSAWKYDLIHYQVEFTALLSSDHGECGLSVILPKIEKEAHA